MNRHSSFFLCATFVTEGEKVVKIFLRKKQYNQQLGIIPFWEPVSTCEKISCLSGYLSSFIDLKIKKAAVSRQPLKTILKILRFFYMMPRTAAVAISTTAAGITPMMMMISTRAMDITWARGATATAGLSSGSVQ